MNQIHESQFSEIEGDPSKHEPDQSLGCTEANRREHVECCTDAARSGVVARAEERSINRTLIYLLAFAGLTAAAALGTVSRIGRTKTKQCPLPRQASAWRRL